MAENEADLPIRKCRECGCTETAACTGRGANCHWVGDDLCSYCDDAMSYLDDGGDDPDDTDEFECHGYFTDGAFYCPMAGTEECDWECRY